MDEAYAALEKYWGYETFRSGQEEAIEAILGGRDALVILPTGGGKSLCYQIPALLGSGFVLVVSPLIALMQDQVAGLQARGIQATFINSTLSNREIDQRWTDAEYGRYRLVYMAPERFQSDRFEARAERLDVSLLAVDEAHCVSEWGHHFRPSYRKIPEARTLLGDPPTIAVTATATPEVRRDIVEQLALRNPARIVTGFDRPNLVWSIFREENKRRKVREIVQSVPGTGLLYAATRRSVERWARWLSDQGETALPYHAGLSDEERERTQEQWLEDETRLVVATNAFGMGIDKPDVRFVVHLELPSSLEAYYQEAGRAGRDGKRSYAVLLFQPPDAETQRSLIDAAHPNAAEVASVYSAVCNLAQVPLGEEPEEPIAVDEDAVRRVTGLTGGKVRAAIELLDREGVWQVLPQRRHLALMRFKKSPGTLRAYADQQENNALAAFVRELLRGVHADAFTCWWPVDLRRLERRTELERRRLRLGLRFLAERDLLEWHPPGEAHRLRLLQPRTKRVVMNDEAVRQARRRAEKRLSYLLRYARSVSCRRQFLLSYFGEGSPDQCGACDVCLGRHDGVVITPEDEPALRRILFAVAAGEPRNAWFDDEAGYRIDALVDWLVQEGYLQLEELLSERFSLSDKGERFVEEWQPRERGEEQQETGSAGRGRYS